MNHFKVLLMPLFCLTLASCSVFQKNSTVAGRATASDDGGLNFTETLLQEWEESEPRLDKKFRTNLSAVECNDDRSFCVLGSDEKNYILLVKKQTDGSYQIERVIDLPTNNGKKSEIDIEAAAYDGTYFYITGSHGVSRKKAKKKKNRHAVYRVLIDQNGQNDEITKASFDDAMKVIPELKKSIKEPLQKNGMNIEGLAIKGNAFYIGFRGPIDRDSSPSQAYVLSVPIAEVFAESSPASYHSTLYVVPIDEGTGIRGMATWNGALLLLGGDSAPDTKEGDKVKKVYETGFPFSIYTWNPGENVSKIRDLSSDEVAEQIKVEAIFSSSTAEELNSAIQIILEGEEPARRSLSIPVQ